MQGKSLAIITARGGSKRIPRKNIKEFCGRPILCYSIEAALSSEAFDEVMVSTDDPEIAGIAMKAGASDRRKRLPCPAVSGVCHSQKPGSSKGLS